MASFIARKTLLPAGVLLIGVGIATGLVVVPGASQGATDIYES